MYLYKNISKAITNEYVVISSICIISASVIFYMYPFTLLHWDSGNWNYYASQFTFFNSNPYDSTRRIPFAWVLHMAVLSDYPGIILRVLHTLLFAGSFLLSQWFLYTMYTNKTTRTALTLCLLLMHTTAMNIFLGLIEALSEPMYSYTLYSGALLLLGGLFKKNTIPLLIGAALLGISSFIKPIGVTILLPLVIILGISFYKKRLSAFMCIISLVLIMFLNVSWQIRESVIGYNAGLQTGEFLFARSMTVYSSTVELFTNESDNTTAHSLIREFHSNVGTTFHNYLYEFQPYAINGVTIGATLEQMTQKEISMPLNQYNKKNTIYSRLAKKIIRQQPLEFSMVVIKSYAKQYNIFAGCRAKNNPIQRYDIHKHVKNIQWYPETVTPSFIPPNNFVIHTFLIPCHYDSQLFTTHPYLIAILVHFIALTSGIVLLFNYKKAEHVSSISSYKHITILTCFAIVAIQFFASNLVHDYQFRYTGSGELFICLIILISFHSMIVGIRTRVSKN